ncbi:MAG: TonB-dependent receptor plug domain-containing protein, partial [Aquabacterium sp.]
MPAQRPRRLRALAAAPALLAHLLPLAAAAQTAPDDRAAQVVVVTAARHAMPAADAPASLSVVTRDDVRARGADNVLEAIRGDIGLSMQGRAVGGRQVLGIRGLDSKHTLFLVDGRRIGASDGTVGASDFQYDWIAAEDIERIEIVRGPLSVLYGSEALGGVINIITREPGERWRLGAAVEGSMADGGRGGGGHRVSMRADGPLGPGLGLRAGAAQTRRSSLTSPTDRRLSELEARDKADGWAGLVWQPVAGQRLDLEVREGRERRFGLARERGGQRRFHE